VTQPGGSGATPDGGVAPSAVEPVVIAVYYPTAEGFDTPPMASDLQDRGPRASVAVRLVWLGAVLLILGVILALLQVPGPPVLVAVGLVAGLLAFRFRQAERKVAARERAWLAGWPRLVADPRYTVGRVSELTLKEGDKRNFGIEGSVTYRDGADAEHVVTIPGGVVPRAGGVEPPALYAPVVVWHSPDNSVVLLRFSTALAT
jgi:xanthosine utilization system XapX-like protein